MKKKALSIILAAALLATSSAVVGVSAEDMGFTDEAETEETEFSDEFVSENSTETGEIIAGNESFTSEEDYDDGEDDDSDDIRIAAIPDYDIAEMQEIESDVYSANAEKNTYIKFVPKRSGKYTIFEKGNDGFSDYTVDSSVYDENFEQLQNSSGKPYEFEAGKVYYIPTFEAGVGESTIVARYIWDVVSMELVGEYSSCVFYAPYDASVADNGKVWLGDPWKGEIKVTYSNGDTEIVSTSERNRNRSWVSRYLVYDGKQKYPEPGIYDVSFELEGAKVILKNGAIIKDRVEMPTVNERGNITVTNNSSVAYTRLKTGDKRVYSVKSSLEGFLIRAYRETENRNESAIPITEDGNIVLEANSVYYFSIMLHSAWSQIDKVTFSFETVDEHEELELRDAREATCEKNGYTGDYYCKECGKLIGRGISIKNDSVHVSDNGTVDEEPTCTDEGILEFKCVKCGRVLKRESIPKTDHKLEISGAKEATCQHEGYTGNKYCVYCDEIFEYGTVIPQKAHNWDEGIITKAATCGTDGIKTYTCSVGGETKTEVIPASGEHKTSLKNQKAASCGENGYTGDKICDLCGTVVEKGQDIPATGHKTSLKNAKTATCTESGYTGDQICDICGTVVEKGKDIPATGHKYGDYKVTKEATIFAAGAESRECQVCHSQEAREIPKLTTEVNLTAKTLPVQVKKSISAKNLIVSKDPSDDIASLTTSNAKVAVVDNNNFKITAKKAGKAVITVTMKSGATSDITVNVKTKKIATTKITGIKKAITLKKGKKYTLKPVLSPITSTDKVTYSTANKKIATVSSKGVIKALKKGKVKITVKAGKKTVTCVVTVK